MTNLSRLPSIVLQVAVTAVLWLALFELNSCTVLMLYLPGALLRMFALMSASRGG